MGVPVCEVCFKQVYKLKLPYTYHTVVTCEDCPMYVLEHDEVAVKKEKIQYVIDKLNKKHFMRTEEIVQMLEDLKNENNN